jgi:hypothetical protein
MSRVNQPVLQLLPARARSVAGWGAGPAAACSCRSQLIGVGHDPSRPGQMRVGASGRADGRRCWMERLRSCNIDEWLLILSRSCLFREIGHPYGTATF